MTEEILAKNIKKVIKWGNGLAVLITKEAKLFKWNDKTRVTVTAAKDEEGEKIVIRRLKL